MKVGIAKRVALAFGVLLFLFFITSAVAFLLTTRIEQGVIDMADPRHARPEVIYLIEADLTASTLALRDHARIDTDGAQSHRWPDRFDKARSLFANSAAGRIDAETDGSATRAFDELAQLGKRAAKLAEESAAARRDLGSTVAAATSKIDAYLEGQGAANEVWPLQRRNAALDSRFWLQELKDKASTSGMLKINDFSQSFERAKRTFKKLTDLYAAGNTSAKGRTWSSSLAPDLQNSERLAERIAKFGAEQASLLVKFENDAGKLNLHLKQKLMPAIAAGRSRAEQGALDSIDRVIIYLSVMTAFGAMMGASTALVLIRGIVRPIVRLTEGAKAIGSGQLDYRIQFDGDDEFSKLANSINRMAEKRLRSEEALRQAANQDSLTRLPNRVVFQDRLAEALSSGARVDRMVAVHLLDLDHFKDVNDTLGHPAGDALLKQVAERLLDCVRKSDTVSRLGGDEFGIIQTNLNSEVGVEVLARRIINSISQPFAVDGERVYTGTSIGITVFPHDDRETDKLIKNADLALYRAKQEGRNKYEFYDAQMNADVQERKALEQDLREALLAGDLFLNYQPKLNLKSGRITGAEALIRWYHEERGMVPPGLFIPVAEETGLITNITDFVLRQVCAQIREWQDTGFPLMRISLNLSPADFKRENLIDIVAGAIEHAKIDPKYLELEITEGMAMTSNDQVSHLLDSLRELGIGLAIDDFGTGYSSMAYLTRFPIDNLKIDQTFIRNITTDSDSANITTAIINLAQSINVAVVAEGVETEEEYNFLRNKGCDEIQGYWISRPVHAAAFAEFVTAHNERADAVSA